MKKFFNLENEAQTVELAQKLAKITKQGDIWALNGTLGAGKTVFARAFIKELSDANEVPSPTFTLLQTYATPEFDIYHYDLYRLESRQMCLNLMLKKLFIPVSAWWNGRKKWANFCRAMFGMFCLK